MECPSCHTGNPAGQKFCGSCGRRLEVACPRCRASNPPGYRFCGQCGANLALAGAITLARSGLITQVNQKALEMLGCTQQEMQGKPFSLFVVQRDLVVFFSHLNDLLSNTKRQSFEINLKHNERSGMNVMLECSVDQDDPKSIDAVHIVMTESTNNHAADRLQRRQELLALIFTATNNISTVSRKHLRQSIEDALKKVCLFTQADICFICSINRATNRLNGLYEWRQASLPEKGTKMQSVPLSRIKRTIIKLRQEKILALSDLAEIDAAEREELLSWHNIEIGSILCYLIYAGKMPIGVIGIAKQAAVSEWRPECESLVKFFGDFISGRLPAVTLPLKEAKKSRPAPSGQERAANRSKADASADIISINEKQRASEAGAREQSPHTADPPSKENWQALPDMTRPMLLESYSGRQSPDQQPVFPRDDGLVLFSCPRCGMQESVSVGQFDKLGNSIQVSCPCKKQFVAVLEKRRYFRKSVRLDGYFSIGGDLGPIGADGNIWGPMVVEDLSKAGLRFSSESANLARVGDKLMVRFNLDNTNQALIHKPVRVVSVNENEVGCKFEGADSYDITLGFYFM